MLDFWLQSVRFRHWILVDFNFGFNVVDFKVVSMLVFTDLVCDIIHLQYRPRTSRGSYSGWESLSLSLSESSSLSRSTSRLYFCHSLGLWLNDLPNHQWRWAFAPLKCVGDFFLTLVFIFSQHWTNNIRQSELERSSSLSQRPVFFRSTRKTKLFFIIFEIPWSSISHRACIRAVFWCVNEVFRAGSLNSENNRSEIIQTQKLSPLRTLFCSLSANPSRDLKPFSDDVWKSPFLQLEFFLCCFCCWNFWIVSSSFLVLQWCGSKDDSRIDILQPGSPAARKLVEGLLDVCLSWISFLWFYPTFPS